MLPVSSGGDEIVALTTPHFDTQIAIKFVDSPQVRAWYLWLTTSRRLDNHCTSRSDPLDKSEAFSYSPLLSSSMFDRNASAQADSI